MGYYTDYCLSFKGTERLDKGSIVVGSYIPEQDVLAIIEEVGRMNIFDDIRYDEIFYANAKWYDWENDMRLLSRKFPDIMFKLSGSGENEEDLWKAYFLNGSMQYCPAIITYEEFDANELDGLNADKWTRYSYQDT